MPGLTTSGSEANSYSTLTELDAYFNDRKNTTWFEAEKAIKEKAAIEATQYIDANFHHRFPGVIQSTSQALEWPRINAHDRSGRDLNGIPDKVKAAQAELALAALSARLVPNEDRGGRIKREQVGNLEVEYMDDAPSGTTYEFAESLLKHVLKRGAAYRTVRV